MDVEQKVVNLRLEDILPNRFQPRIRFDEMAINELSESIKEHGVIQPIIVRQIGDKYEIIAGERRYKASLMAGKETIPAIIKNLNDHESAEIALIENVQRRDLTPIEEAISYRKILDMGYLTQEGLASKLDKSQSAIANKLRLLNLHESVQEALLEEKISERHARSLLKLPNERQEEMLDRIITERLTVRQTDTEISKILNPVDEVKQDEAIFNIENIKENKEGEFEMYNDKDNQNNIFNIPTEPIIEEESGQRETLPGFVNIDEIEKNATDIFADDLLKPQPNIDLLLQSEPVQSTNPAQEDLVSSQNDFFGQTNVISTPNLENEEQEDEEEPIFKPGRFFGVENDNIETNFSQNNFDFLKSETFNDSFDSALNNANNLDGNVFSSELDMDLESLNHINSNEATEPLTETVNVNNEVKTDDNFDSYNLNDIFVEPEIIDFDGSNVPNTSPVLDESSEEGAAQYTPLYTFDDFDSMPEFNNIGQNNKQAETRNESDLRIAVNTVRELIKILEDQGYTVDSDEADLENTYEFTIKIMK